jgi:hypothetical protein
MTMGSNGLGKVFPTYLTDDEKRAGSATNRGHVAWHQSLWPAGQSHYLLDFSPQYRMLHPVPADQTTPRIDPLNPDQLKAGAFFSLSLKPDNSDLSLARSD